MENKKQYTWSNNWIQPYESPWGILEKFMWANVINGNSVLALIGNEKIQQLKNISRASIHQRDLINFSSIDSKLSQKIIGIDLKKYHNKLTDKTLHLIPNIDHERSYFHSYIAYCPLCLSKGYHSILHQIKLFDHCAFHPSQILLDRCVKCDQLMPEYLINRGNQPAFHCACGHNFLNSNISLIFFSWQKHLKIKNRIISAWLKLPRNEVHKYHIIYPFDNYNISFEVDKKETDYLRLIPKLLINAFNEDILNNEVIKISSKVDIFKIKNNYQQLKDNYIDAFPTLFPLYNFTKKDRIDSVFFEIYKQTRIIYKAITRFILQKVIKDHSKCVKIFNKARQAGDLCPHAYAFILWKMECEGIDAFWKIRYFSKTSKNHEFKCMNKKFSIFLQGTFISHLEEILNPFGRKNGFNIMECNISGIKYIVDKIISHLLIERYVKWLELVQDPEKYKNPDDSIPMYIAKIPQNLNGEVSFHFQKSRIDYMNYIVKDLNEKFTCPFNKRTKYPTYESPLKIQIDALDF
ncbi:hypothetical protein [Alkalihalobacillus sp. 1P02AB]|uniref:hypothetical protein n=1 Tax=Alkalihalobacillus sp. 1P02AB TaxID=3132260 RepID=UPI0039A485A3